MIKKIVSVCVFVVLLCFSFVGCDVPPENAQHVASKQNEQAVQNIIKNDRLPVMEHSLERENIKRRAVFVNQKDRICYLYLLTENGQLIRESQVLGKISSLNNYITPMEEVVSSDKKLGDCCYAYVTEAPDIDGTWGTRPEGIFWFTPDGQYHEWNGLYEFSSERLTFTTKPILIESLE